MGRLRRESGRKIIPQQTPRQTKRQDDQQRPDQPGTEAHRRVATDPSAKHGAASRFQSTTLRVRLDRLVHCGMEFRHAAFLALRAG